MQYGNDMSEEEILKYIKTVDAEDIFKTLPNGLNTECGINGEVLSGGQKQLVHFIKNINKKNKLIILDEPTAAIDKANTKNIIEAIKILSQNSTLIIITHDKSLLEIVDRVITLDEGKIISDVSSPN